MSEWNIFGKMFMLVGLGFLALGLIFLLGAQVFKIGRLPGDIIIQRGNFTFFFPLATSITISIVLTIIVNLIIRR